MISRWMDEKREAIQAEVQGRIHEHDIVDVPHRQIGGIAAVVSTYHPHGVAGLPVGPSHGDPDAAGEIINQGKATIDQDRQRSQANRASAMLGSADLQSEVNGDHDREFFRDPKLRK